MTPHTSLHHLSQLTFDLLLLEDLGADAARSARRHIDACAACRENYEQLRDSYKHFETNVHPRTAARLTGEVHADRPGRRGRPRHWSALAAAITFAAALGLWFRTFSPSEPSSRSDNDVIVVKGSPVLTVYARRAGRVFALNSGAHVQPGDALRFTADPGAYSFLLIASIDAAGKATVYFPYLGKESGAIAPDRHFSDDSSIVLDDTRGPERIFALFSGRPLDASIVQSSLASLGRQGLEAIRSADRIDIPADFQTSVLIEK